MRIITALGMIVFVMLGCVDSENSGSSHHNVNLSETRGSVFVPRASDIVGGEEMDTVIPAALPFSADSIVTDGEASVTSSYSLSNDAFEISFSHSRVGASGSYALSNGAIYFSVDRDVAYEASAIYSAADPEGRRTFLRVSLVDFSIIDQPLLSGMQNSNTTRNQTFTLGQSDGDDFNANWGTLTGTLLAGRDYFLHYSASIESSPSPSASNATALGSVSLRLGPTQ